MNFTGATFALATHVYTYMHKVFSQLWAFGSLLSNIFIDDFSVRQSKKCVRILKGSHNIMKWSSIKYTKQFDIYLLSRLGPQLTK